MVDNLHEIFQDQDARLEEIRESMELKEKEKDKRKSRRGSIKKQTTKKDKTDEFKLAKMDTLDLDAELNENLRGPTES